MMVKPTERYLLAVIKENSMQTRWQRCVLSIVLLAVLITIGQLPVASAEVNRSHWPTAPTAPVNREQINKLIDRLATISDQGVGFNAMANASAFAPVDTVPKFEGGILGTPAPAIPAPLRDIVALGIQALPVLLEHVDDRRPTGLKITHKYIFGSMWYAKEFDVRPYDRNPRPRGIGKGDDLKSQERISEHIVTIGDMCYVAIGQIVNRNYSVVRYQPTACIVINSPTHTPALANAVREEWRGVTKAEHQYSLLTDMQFLARGARAGEALKRLCYYYPDTGKAVALSLLRRPLCNDSVAQDFTDNKLIEIPEFQAGDIRNVKGFLRRLGHSDNLMKYVVHKMNDGIGYGEKLGEPGESISDNVQGATVRLNHLLGLKDLYSPKVFAGVRLRQETRQMLAKHPQGFDLVCAHRMLLEDTFPGVLARRAAPSRDPAIWKSRVAKFASKQGPSYKDYLWNCLNTRSEGGWGDYDTAIAERAQRIIRALYPNRDNNHPGFINATDADNQQNVVENLSEFHNKDLERAVNQLLLAVNRRVITMQSSKKIYFDEEFEIQWCGIACIEYLNGRGYKANCKEFCSRNLALLTYQFRRIGQDDTEWAGLKQRFDTFKEQIKHLQ